MSTARIIEVDGTTAGIAIVERNGCVFFASQQPFFALDGSLFPSMEQATAAAGRLLRRRQSRKSRPANPTNLRKEPS